MPSVDPSGTIALIDAAFASVPRPETSLRQFRLTDQKGMTQEISDQEWAEAGRHRRNRKWQDIPDDELAECGVLLAHMGPEEIRYYLPAYMRYALKNQHLPIWEDDTMGSVIFSVDPRTNEPRAMQYKLDQLSLLDKNQCRAIVAFLEFAANDAQDIHRPDARKALERYWYKHWSQIG
jgi:hypothetical protein